MLAHLPEKTASFPRTCDENYPWGINGYDPFTCSLPGRVGNYHHGTRLQTVR